MSIAASARSVQLLALAFLALLHSATAATDVLQGDIYLMDSFNQVQNYTTLTAGQTYVAIFQVQDQASNATIGTVFGFCTVLRDVGPSQCQYTIQLASGSVQVFTHRQSPIAIVLALLLQLVYAAGIPVRVHLGLSSHVYLRVSQFMFASLCKTSLLAVASVLLLKGQPPENCYFLCLCNIYHSLVLTTSNQ